VRNQRAPCEEMKKVGILAIIVCLFLVFALTTQASQVRGQGETSIILAPALVQVYRGEEITVTINATNIMVLSAWQVTLKYNSSVVNVTEMWVPEFGVFDSLPQINPEPFFGTDVIDGLGYVDYERAIVGNPVSVSNGILCMANITALADGQTTILIATTGNRAHKTINEYDSFYSNLFDADLNDIPYIIHNGMIVVIPEFPSWSVLAPLIAVTLLTVTLYRRRKGTWLSR